MALEAVMRDHSKIKTLHYALAISEPLLFSEELIGQELNSSAQVKGKSTWLSLWMLASIQATHNLADFPALLGALVSKW